MIVGAELVDRVDGGAARSRLGARGSGVTATGRGGFRGSRIDLDSAAGACRADRGTPVTIDDRALYIYTSGTTGLPKAARVSHARLMQWTHWFAGLMDVSPGDRMYNCLPMYHSAGGVLAAGAVLVGGGSVVIGAPVFRRRFWDDIVGWDCTLFQYIGELCRYLAQRAPHPVRDRPPPPAVLRQRLARRRVAGLQAAVSHSADPRVLRVDGRQRLAGERRRHAGRHRPDSAVSRAPVSRRRSSSTTRRPPRRCATRADSACRARRTRWARRSAASIGTARMSAAGSRATPTTAASRQSILRDVFEPGDAWCRTGDLMRRDERGYFYFVDRIGDTFRWKGENVATTEVPARSAGVPASPTAPSTASPCRGPTGRAGMAAIVDRRPVRIWPRSAAHRASIRCRTTRARFSCASANASTATATFKHTTHALIRTGYDPDAHRRRDSTSTTANARRSFASTLTLRPHSERPTPEGAPCIRRNHASACFPPRCLSCCVRSTARQSAQGPAMSIAPADPTIVGGADAAVHGERRRRADGGLRRRRIHLRAVCRTAPSAARDETSSVSSATAPGRIRRQLVPVSGVTSASRSSRRRRVHLRPPGRRDGEVLGARREGTARRRHVQPNRARPVAVQGLAERDGAGRRLQPRVRARRDGTMRCWGSNRQRPARQSIDQPGRAASPVAVTDVSGALAVAAGAFHTCALLAGPHRALLGRERRRAARGRHEYDLVHAGDGAAALSNVAAISAGGGHTCAVLTDGSVQCWGDGYQGQLGDGAGRRRRRRFGDGHHQRRRDWPPDGPTRARG